MSELQRLKGLLPPEMQSWVFVEAAASVDPPLITIEEIGRDEVEIQVDLEKWDGLALDHRNLLFWHEVGRIQNDAIPRDGWEMAALAIGLGGAIGELWVQDGLLLLMALGLSGFAGYRLYLKNNSEKRLQDAILADERAIDLACRFGYSLPNAYKSLGGALKELVEQTRKKRRRSLLRRPPRGPAQERRQGPGRDGPAAGLPPVGHQRERLWIVATSPCSPPRPATTARPSTSA